MKHTTPDNLIEKIDAVEIEESRKPVEFVVAELRQFGQALVLLKDRFTQKGLSPEFLLVAEPLADELQQREAEWLTGRFVSPEIKEKWDAAWAEGNARCSSLMDDLEISFYGNVEAMRALSQIEKGKGPEDMLQDIPQLVHLAETNLSAVAEVGITQEFLDETKVFGAECQDLFASSVVSDDEVEPIKEARDRAKTFAVKYLSLVRFYADRLFRREPDLREKFVSRYEQERNDTYR